MKESKPTSARKRAQAAVAFGDGNDNSPCDDPNGDPLDNRPKPKLSGNPIVAIVQRALARSNVKLTWAVLGEATEASRRIIYGRPDELKRELGGLLLAALERGDTDFSQTVKQAVREIGEVFHRDREKTLLEAFFR